LTEYSDCREEIKIRIQQRTRMTEFYIIGLTAIAGFAIQSGNYLIMAIAPAYAMFIHALILGTYFYTDSLAHYIREEIELKKIPHILGGVPQMKSLGKTTSLEWKTGWLGWETNFEACLKGFNPIRRRKILYLFSWGTILTSHILRFGNVLSLRPHHRMVVTQRVSWKAPQALIPHVITLPL